MDVKIDKELIKHVAQVARLNLTDKKTENFSKELKEIIGFFSKLEKVDTTDIDVSLQAIELKNNLREDKEEKSFTQKEVLSLTEHIKEGYFKGPKAI